MKAELGQWNNGNGITLDQWVGCIGNLNLAIGYSTIFWPKFEAVGKYILTEGWKPEAIRGCEVRQDMNYKNVEWVLNHFHLCDLHAHNKIEVTADQLLHLGNTLKEIYTVKLRHEFPERPCVVEFFIPTDPDDLVEYQISFWQAKWDAKP